MDLDLHQACLDTKLLPRCSVVLEMERNPHVVKTKKRQVFPRQRLYHLPFQGNCRGKRYLKISVQGKTNISHKESLSPCGSAVRGATQPPEILWARDNLQCYSNSFLLCIRALPVLRSTRLFNICLYFGGQFKLI